MEMRVVFKDLQLVTCIEHKALKRCHPSARFVSRVLLESLCSVASKGDSVLMRLQSRAEVERQLLNAYLGVLGKEREEEGWMILQCVDKQGCSEGDSCLTTGAHDNP